MSKVKLNEFDAKAGLNRGASKMKEMLWYVMKCLFFLSPLPFPYGFKNRILRFFGAKIGNNVIIKPRVNIHFPWKLIIGNDVWIGEEVFILNFERCTIGNNVCVSQRTFLCGGNHDFRDPSMKYRNGSITLEDGTWIGASCFVGPNVIVGTDSVITAGSILTSSVDGNGVFRGNPATYVGSRWK